jgi:choline/glycine/proline betaine transport protein
MTRHDQDPPSGGVTVGRFWIFPHVSRPVFITSAALILIFSAFAALFTSTADAVFALVNAWVSTTFGWFYIFAASLFLVFVAYVALSRYGHVRLGDPFEEPTFSLGGWFGMLFSAGMGIGLVFWSVAEPMSHFVSPPFGAPGDATVAMRLTFYHWGLHAWGIYCVVGMAIGYFAFRQKLPLTIRSAFYPLLGDRIYGPIGHAIDVLAIFGTMFGVATSLGLGVLQINAGLDYLWGVGESAALQLVIIALVTLFATVSVLLGLSKGVQRLSQLNILLSVVLLVFVLVVGPTLFLLRFLVEGVGDYLQYLPGLSLWNDAVARSGWQEDWTIFYWGWWISWAPFVGMFIARVSRGRTIRQFVAGALLAPTLAGFVWMTVLGGTGLDLQRTGVVDLGAAVTANVSTALFVMLDQLPWAAITATLATTLVVTYFVTSSDSGSLVIDMLAAGGHTDPPKVQRVFWAVSEGVVAAVLLVAGGLSALRAASIAAGLPFAVIMLFICVALLKALRSEPVTPDAVEREPEAPADTMGDVVHLEEGAEPLAVPPPEPPVVRDEMVATDGAEPAVEPEGIDTPDETDEIDVAERTRD